MSLSVITSPAGFKPVGTGKLDLILQETSIAGKPNYRIEIEMDGLGLPVFEFFAAPDLSITCDLAVIIRAALLMAQSTSARFKTTHAKYRGVWDGGAYSQVDLSSDVIYGYIGSNNHLNFRTQFELTSGGGPILGNDTIYVWAGRYAYIDFLYDGLDVDSQVEYVEDGGSPVQLLAFDGSGKGMISVEQQYLSSGVVNISQVGSTVYKTLKIVLMPECKNPILLRWMRNYGGLTSWLFDEDQEYSLNPDDDGVLNTKRVFARGLNFETWSMLNELNKKGAEYGDNLKLGAFVQDITGDAINVFVEDERAGTQTKKFRHEFQITLRYPIVDNILI